jgi:hypothetical protein
MWTAGETINYGDSRRHEGREYRFVNVISGLTTHLCVTAPTHTSGDVSVWRFVRNYSGAQIAALESRQAFNSGKHQTAVVNVPAHGLVLSTARGEPLTTAMTGVYDDTTAATNTDCRILLDVISEDYLVVADPGDTIELPSTLIGTASYSISGSGRTLYWDSSAGKYLAAKPGDSHATAPAVLRVNMYSATTFQARVLTNPSF